MDWRIYSLLGVLIIFTALNTMLLLFLHVRTTGTEDALDTIKTALEAKDEG